MLIKFDADDKFAEALKAVTGQRVASKAFLSAAVKYPDLFNYVKELDRENRRLKQAILAQQQILNGARDAAKLLIEKVGQEDMFVS